MCETLQGYSQSMQTLGVNELLSNKSEINQEVLYLLFFI